MFGKIAHTAPRYILLRKARKHWPKLRKLINPERTKAKSYKYARQLSTNVLRRHLRTLGVAK